MSELSSRASNCSKLSQWQLFYLLDDQMFKVLTLAGGLEMHGFVDGSNFSDIFDVDWFIQSVARDVKVIKELPPASKRFLLKQLYSLRVPRKVTPHYYLTRILPILKRRHVRFFSLRVVNLQFYI